MSLVPGERAPRGPGREVGNGADRVRGDERGRGVARARGPRPPGRALDGESLRVDGSPPPAFVGGAPGVRGGCGPRLPAGPARPAARPHFTLRRGDNEIN